MSEFGLELPTATKLGVDGKGPKAYIVKQSNMTFILVITAVLVLLSGCLLLDIQAERTKFNDGLNVEHRVQEHQRLGKLEAETKLAEMSAKMSEHTLLNKDEESDLKIMASHINYVQHQTYQSIMKSIDDESLTVADIKKHVDKQFSGMETEIESILHNHLVVVEGANAKSSAEIDRIEKEVHDEIASQQAYDNELKTNRVEQVQAHANDRGPTEEKQIEQRIQQVFDHVYNLAEKMGDNDIDVLLDETNVKAWQQLLEDAESGKIAYPDAVAKMEEVVTKAPVALKLAEVTGAMQLIEEDGGAKGVTEITNFRNLLREIRWLPQISAVLEEFSAWKNGERTVQQVLAWIEEKMATGEVDGVWLARAYDKLTAVPPATKATSTTIATAVANANANTKAPAIVSSSATATATTPTAAAMNEIRGQL